MSEGLRPKFLSGTPVPLTHWKGVAYSRKSVENLRDGCRFQEVRIALSLLTGGPAAEDGDTFLSSRVAFVRSPLRSARRRFSVGVCLS